MGETETVAERPSASSSSSSSSSSSPARNGLDRAVAARPTRRRAAARYWAAEVSRDGAIGPIIACCVVAGLCDSSAYNAWSCFVSMQTGNTIFLALGASGQPAAHPDGWRRSLVSIALFFAGCLAFGATRRLHPLQRRTLAASFALQALCVFAAAALVQAGVVPTVGATAQGSIEMLPLGLLAFQSGGQIVTSRLLGFNEVPTTVLTSVYCDLASDPRLLAPLGENVKRNRRVAAVVAILAGGVAGGWLYRSAAGMASALWLGGAIKLAIAFSWSLWKDVHLRIPADAGSNARLQASPENV